MSFQFPISLCINGDTFFQQIENHLTDGIDLITVGMRQQVFTFESIGFLQNTFQERTLSLQPLHRLFLAPVVIDIVVYAFEA